MEWIGGYVRSYRLRDAPVKSRSCSACSDGDISCGVINPTKAPIATVSAWSMTLLIVKAT
jgi:hypothetical protein